MKIDLGGGNVCGVLSEVVDAGSGQIGGSRRSVSLARWN